MERLSLRKICRLEICRICRIVRTVITGWLAEITHAGFKLQVSVENPVVEKG
ncbi:hypothetical protein HMPREF1287_02297 [Corynebacterium sp. KPL1986]|nr:hypothetical protein HMPREF1287_02297 [Corynebacterium sp. KPL1986]ERS43722.1 hypothetical protein HMPREF1293_00673 [Corynebacterium sp. KPL1996]ERS74802.1 hypothetical protein HMPREF1300_00668 [Corynebacterium sp. KPL2004]ERS75571.1 hypothetical protein HMPREF1295_00152 [Corynebacterium sp. KPL1998]